MYKIGLLILVFFMNSCIGTEKPPRSVTQEYVKTLLVIGDDRSGSTGTIRKLDKNDYASLMNCVIKSGGGTFAVCLIGNAEAQSREPFTCQMEQLDNIILYNPKDTHLTLSEKRELKLKNEKILHKNQLTIESNNKKLSEFIDNTLIPNVLNYSPMGRDHTDLDDAINRINILINEPQYADYDKIIVSILSDGKHDVVNGSQTGENELTNQKAEVYLVGWQTDTSIFKVGNLHKLSSKESLIRTVQNILSHE